MIEKTKQVNKVVLRDNVLKSVIEEEMYNALRVKLQKKYHEIEAEYFSSDWIEFSLNGQHGFWNKQTEIIIPLLNVYKETKDKYFDILKYEALLADMRILFDEKCPEAILKGIKASKSFEKGHWVSFKNGSYCIETGQCSSWNDEDSIPLCVVKQPFETFKKCIISGEYSLPIDSVFKKCVCILKGKTISEISKEKLDKLSEILGIDKEIIINEVSERIRNNYTMSTDIRNIFSDNLLSCDRKRADLEKYTSKCIEDVNSGHWELWSERETVAEEGQILVQLEKPMVARNPLADIHYDGLIGIDFGTKSTIVSKRDGKEFTTLMRVGIGQLAKEAEKYHYENPTIMEFINLNKFLENYAERNGRPETSIDDIRVSHAAENDLKACSVSDEFYSYFYDIKQWCGDTERNIKIIDQKGHEHVLPSFITLEEGQLNPLEIYAYYLGLYINNMRNGIYLDYVLSFPVTYEKAVKEKILDSFTKGLKKSLPETVLNDEDVMKKFRVRQGVSEPAAYAITALKGYNFEPEEGENILYAIFDFGGGTTDFDFGLWRMADDSKREEELYDNVIEHFGSEGDKYLGGENLLELMAFEVFKANAKLLGKSIRNENESTAGFSFTKPKECDEFPGSETFISDSQEARRNTKQVMEVLRPFWEGIIKSVESSSDKILIHDDAHRENIEALVGVLNEVVQKKGGKTEDSKETSCNQLSVKEYSGYIFRDTENCKFPIDDGAITVDLFDRDGKRYQKKKLYIENIEHNINVDLIKILENRIKRGVELFFNAIVQVFRNKSAVESNVNEIQIFLAGNSSKSPVLRKLFDEYIDNMNKSLDFNGSSDGHFNLFPPLGTDDAFKIQKERGIDISKSDITSPTGKTGVAYGLIAGRKGGTVKVISEIKADAQTKFRYNVGINKRGKFVVKLDRNKVEYGQWIRFINASEEDFEIYYTSAPVPQNSVPINSSGIYNKCCRLAETNEDADIYIRCTSDSPEEIEYCVSVGEPENVEIVRLHLGE